MFGPNNSNMGPFGPVSLKGNARINGVPVFVDKLPLTMGGIAGENIPFGRVVSIVPSVNRREFKLGKPNNSIVKGISFIDPVIMRAKPGRNDYYQSALPMSIATFGILDIIEYDVTQNAPMEGSTVWFRNDNGMLAFNDGTDISGNGYTKLNAQVYETLDPNGAKIFFGMPFTAVQQTRETTTRAVTPTATPAAGAVAVGTAVTLATTTPGAKIFYTTDGTDPSPVSKVYAGPIQITSAVTIKAVAVAPDASMDSSTVLTAAYTLV